MFTYFAKGDCDISSSIIKSGSKNVILTILNIPYSLIALYLLFTRENDLSVGLPKLAAINSSILNGRSIRFVILFKGYLS